MNTTYQNRSVAIHVSDLHQSYGSFEAVRGVSFTVAPGELFALLGTNGAGKTTTIETLEGFRRPTRGSVRIFGIDPFGQPPELRPRVNAVLQHSGLFEELTVTESIELARDLADDPMDTAEVLEAVVLADKARNTVRSLSGGERRRLDLGLAILTRPDVLVLDEPTTGMDPEMRRETWKIISSQVARGAAVAHHALPGGSRTARRPARHHAPQEIRVSGTVSEVVSQWGDRILPSALPHPLRELPELPGAELTIDVRGDHQWAVYTVTTGTDPATRTHHALLPLLKWAEERSLDLERLESVPPPRRRVPRRRARRRHRPGGPLTRPSHAWRGALMTTATAAPPASDSQTPETRQCPAAGPAPHPHRVHPLLPVPDGVVLGCPAADLPASPVRLRTTTCCPAWTPPSCR